MHDQNTQQQQLTQQKDIPDKTIVYLYNSKQEKCINIITGVNNRVPQHKMLEQNHYIWK